MAYQRRKESLVVVVGDQIQYGNGRDKFKWGHLKLKFKGQEVRKYEFLRTGENIVGRRR